MSSIVKTYTTNGARTVYIYTNKLGLRKQNYMIESGKIEIVNLFPLHKNNVSNK